MAKHQYVCEMTDTFSGEANYCWVKRVIVNASTRRGAIIKAAAHFGVSGRIRKTMDCGDMTRHDVQGAAICIFTNDADEFNTQGVSETI